MKKYIQEHKYVLLVLYLPIYLIWFALVERMVPSTEGCFVSYLPLDDKIPFLPGFILAYVLWYPFLIVPVVVTLLKDDRRAFIRYAAFNIAGFSISLTICMIWPNCQLMRPSRRSSLPLRSARPRCLSSSTTFWMCLRRSRCRWCCT